MCIKGNGIQLLLPRLDVLWLSMVFSDSLRTSNLVLTWTPLITCSNPSGCSPHFSRSRFVRLLFSFNIIPVYRGTARLSHGSPHKLLIYLVQKGGINKLPSHHHPILLNFVVCHVHQDIEDDQSDQHIEAYNPRSIHLHVNCKQCT